MRNFISTLIIIFVFKCDNKTVNNESKALDKTDAEKLKKELYGKYSSDIKTNGSNTIENHKITYDNRELKYDLKYFGEKPTNGWELYISLHGGGAVSDAYNDSQWERHKELYKLENGILLTPRSPTNTWNMWHQEHIDKLFDKLIKNMIIIKDVDPNKIYLLGYSAGGDGVYQLAPRMADRFAAAAMMAGHPNDANPLGLRNIGFTIHMGENDSAFNRNKVALEWEKKLMFLRKNDPRGYKHQVNIYKGKGHNISHAKKKGISRSKIDDLDSSGISWISNFTRTPYPKKIVWKQDDVTRDRYYWLKVTKPQKNSLIIASINKQTITIEETTITNIVFRLNDDMINMDEKVIIKYLGKEIFNEIVNRNKKTISNSIKEYGDPKSIYFGEITIDLNIKNNGLSFCF